jgi:glycosyltransferase involved in cell wall biosynthesis
VYQEQGVIIHPLLECQSRRQRYARAPYVAQMAADLKPDLFHVHEPDLLGPVLAKADTIPVIYDVHESYLDILKDCSWLPKWVKPLVGFAWDQWERRLVRRCAGVVAVTEPIALRYSLLHDKVRIVTNYPDWQSIEDLPPVKRDGTTCVFAGVLNPNRGLSQIFKALALLKERGLTVPLALAGVALSDEYLVSLWEEATRLGIRAQVQYHGVLSKSKALALQHYASIGLITYLPLRHITTSLPNKLVECMGLGLPVVCSDFPIYREVAGATGAGIMVDPTKPEQIANAIESLVRSPALAQQMGESGRRAVRERFNWEAEGTKLLHLYHELIGAPDGSKSSKVTNPVIRS